MKTAKHLQEAEELIDAVRTELTDLILELRPQVWDGRDLAPVLRETAAAWAHQTGIEVDAIIEEPADLSLEMKQGIYRIVQEALSNVYRHSGADRVVLRLTSDSEACLTVEDNGTGFDPEERTGGLGLLSMSERAEAVGGNLYVTSTPGSGTCIEVRFQRDDRSGDSDG